MQKILFTGSSGTIGTGVFLEAIRKGFEAIGVDKNPNRWYEELNKKTIVGDLLKKETFDELEKLDDLEMIVHLAANPLVYKSVINPKLAKENIDIVFNILEFARKKDIPRIIFASSRETYGKNYYPKKEDEVRIEKCESPYTASKIAGEALMHAYSKCYGIDIVIIRYSNVYGKYDISDRVIPLFLRRAVKNQELIVYGENKTLDFTYVDDAVNGTIKAIEKFDEVKGETFNLATGKGTKIVDVARIIKTITGSKSEIVIKENREGEIDFFVADISKAKEKLEYEPKTDITKGLELSYVWYKEKGLL